MASEPQSAPPTKLSEVLTAIERQFWERVYIAALEIAQRQASPSVPWSGRNAEIADTALERWRERFGQAAE